MLNQTKDNLFSQMPSISGVKEHLGQRTRGDKYIWGLFIVLALVAILVVYSATGSLAYKSLGGNTTKLLIRQLEFTLVGIVVIFGLHRVNYTMFSRIASILYALSIPLLIYTLIWGTKINDGSRWIKLPIIHLTFQSSDKKGFLPVIIPVMLTCVLIMPANLSNALLTGASSLLLMFIGRISLKHIGLTILVAMVPLLIIISVAVATHKAGKAPVAEVEKPMVVEKSKIFIRFNTWVSRVQDFIYPNEKEAPYQVQQSKIAIANGGIFFGLGPGNSHQRNFLPQAYNDFIYAIIIEEYGLIGGAFIIFVYLVFLYRCIRIFRKCPYAFGAFLALGLSFTLIVQAIANMAVTVGLVPVTGVTLPLISMGGSSFVFTCCSIGIILSVARNVEQLEGNAPEETEIEIPQEAEESESVQNPIPKHA